MIYIAFSLFSILILALAFYQWQHLMVFTPTTYRSDELNESFELLEIKTDDGVSLEGVVYEPKESHGTVLFFAGRSHDSVGLIKKLSISFPDVRIITFNYRSYGKSGGRVSEKNIFKDALKIATLVKKNYGDFYLLGFSLGSILSSYIASQISVSGLILVGSFDSLSSMIKEKYGLNLNWLLRYKLDNEKYIKKVDTRVCIFASKADEMVPINNVRKLKQHVKNLYHYEEFEDLSHKELLWNKNVISKINSFIKV